MFAQTGFRIDRDSFWDYFQPRGGVTTFGYPVSRDFPFMGCTSQFFQRLIMQQCGTQGVEHAEPARRRPAALHPHQRQHLPRATRTRRSTPPRPRRPIRTTATSIQDFVRANTVDTFDGQPVNFQKTFFSTITPEIGQQQRPEHPGPARPGDLGRADQQAGAYDPTNNNFIYQRFQRGIMHYDKSLRLHAGPAAGRLPEGARHRREPAGRPGRAGRESPLLRSAQAARRRLATVFGNAFIKGAGSVTVDAPTPASAPTRRRPACCRCTWPPSPGTTVFPAPPPVPSPDYGLSMFLWDQSDDHGSRPQDRQQLELPLAEDAVPVASDRRQRQGHATTGPRPIASSRPARPTASRSSPASTSSRTGHARTACDNGPPDNYQDYADFIPAFATRYQAGFAHRHRRRDRDLERGQPRHASGAWQTINQQQAADYVRLLTLAYRAATTANPTDHRGHRGSVADRRATTATPWTTPTYMQWLFDAGLKGGINYDVLGAHGNTQAPEVDVPLQLAAGLRPSELLLPPHRAVARQSRSKTATAIVRSGCSSSAGPPTRSTPTTRGSRSARTRRPSNIVKAFQYARKHWSPWIGVMTLWTLADPTWTPEREEYWWAIDNPDGTPRAALNAVRAARLTGQF